MLLEWIFPYRLSPLKPENRFFCSLFSSQRKDQPTGFKLIPMYSAYMCRCAGSMVYCIPIVFEIKRVQMFLWRLLEEICIEMHKKVVLHFQKQNKTKQQMSHNHFKYDKVSKKQCHIIFLNKTKCLSFFYAFHTHATNQLLL